VEYSGPFGNRTIRYKLKAKPLSIEKINLRGYGCVSSNFGNDDPSLLKNLKLKKGEQFSRWAVQESTEYLRKAYTKDGYWAEVRAQEELSGADELQVTFSVLVFPLQIIVVDGHVLQSTKEHAKDAAGAQ
jgi:outer membrane protein assembly factor BamA